MSRAPTRSTAYVHYDVFVCAVSQETLERLRETFRRLSTASGYLPQATFLRDVLGETVPAKLSDVSLA